YITRLSFQSYGLLSPLLSFPTRRSSELFPRCAATLRGYPSGPELHGRLEPEPRDLEDPPGASRPARGPAAADLPDGRAGGAVGGDRKSTRLNSSHVKISYAVFCLKKKPI